MKYNKKYLFAACAALLLGMQSCDLEEYNPAGSTPDNVYKEQAGLPAIDKMVFNILFYFIFMV